MLKRYRIKAIFLPHLIPLDFFHPSRRYAIRE